MRGPSRRRRPAAAGPRGPIALRFTPRAVHLAARTGHGVSDLFEDLSGRDDLSGREVRPARADDARQELQVLPPSPAARGHFVIGFGCR